MEKFSGIVAVCMFIIVVALSYQSHRVSVTIHNTVNRVVTEQVNKYFNDNPVIIEYNK